MLWIARDRYDCKLHIFKSKPYRMNLLVKAGEMKSAFRENMNYVWVASKKVKDPGTSKFPISDKTAKALGLDLTHITWVEGPVQISGLSIIPKYIEYDSISQSKG